MKCGIPSCLVCLVVLMVAGYSCQAEEVQSCDQELLEARGWTLNVENDLIWTDESYTNGLQYHQLDVYAPCVKYKVKGKKSRVPLRMALLDEDNIIVSYKVKSYGFGMNMYTPKDITVSSVIPNDRPYAGVLLFNMGNQTNTISRADKDKYEESVFHNFSIGCIGPCAIQEQVQVEWHEFMRRLFNRDTPAEPKGWDNQIDNELAFQYTYENRKMFYSSGAVYGNNRRISSYDATRIYRILAGNIFDTAEAGILLRWGKLNNILYKSNFSIDLIKQYELLKLRGEEANIEGLLTPVLREKYIYLKTQVRGVLYNATLEGGLIGKLRDDGDDIYTVNSRPATIDFEVGVSYETEGSGVWDISLASRSTEFEEAEWKAVDHKWLQIKYTSTFGL